MFSRLYHNSGRIELFTAVVEATHIHTPCVWKCLNSWSAIEFVWMIWFNLGRWSLCLGWNRKEFDAMGWKSCLFLELFAGPDCLLSILERDYPEGALAARIAFHMLCFVRRVQGKHVPKPEIRKLCRPWLGELSLLTQR